MNTAALVCAEQIYNECGFCPTLAPSCCFCKPVCTELGGATNGVLLKIHRCNFGDFCILVDLLGNRKEVPQVDLVEDFLPTSIV